MRSRVAALMLLVVLSVMSLLIRPAPAPAILDIGSSPKEMGLVAEPAPASYGILDIGPPPKGETAEDYRQQQITGQTHFITLSHIWWRVKTFPSIASRPPLNHRAWLAENLRVTAEEGSRRLRFTFEAGTRAEQVTVINAYLRNSLSNQERSLKWGEECLRTHEKLKLLATQRINKERNPNRLNRLKKELEIAEVADAELRVALARRKVVIRWAE